MDSFENFVKELKEVSVLTSDTSSNSLEDSYLAIDNKIVLGNQFYYLLDIVNMKLIHVSKNFWSILGYDPQEITGEFIFKIIHPEDRENALNISVKALEFSRKVARLEPGLDIFSVDLRIQHADGHYLRMLRQLGVNKIDESGTPIQAFALWTDITEIKKSDKMEFSYTGPHQITFNSLKEVMNKAVIFTARELEVLSFLTKGLSTKETASKMGIGYETVVSHKKNMKKKGEFSHTSQLIKYGVEMGLI